MEELEAIHLNPRIEEAVQLIAKMGQDKLQFTETLAQKKFEWRGLLSLSERKEELVLSVIHERKKIELLQLLLKKLRFADKAYQKKPIKACLSAQEMRKHNLHFRMVHGSKNLAKEKRLLKEIKGSQKLDEEEEDFASFWNQWEANLATVTKYSEDYRKYQIWWWHIDRHEQIWWLQHQVPFLISKGDTKDHEREIRELQCRIESCGVVLLKKTDKTKDTTPNACPSFVMGKTWTSMGPKALQEQIKLAGKKIEESRKTLLALGLGSRSGQAQRNLEGVEKDMASLRKKLPGLDQRKNEAHQCILEVIKQQA